MDANTVKLGCGDTMHERIDARTKQRMHACTHVCAILTFYTRYAYAYHLLYLVAGITQR